jgi:hypothetical protein
MKNHRFFLLLFSLSGIAIAGHAADKHMLAVPGKVLYQNKFEEAPGKPWRAAKGKWEAIDGVMRGSELEADKHGAVNRLQRKFSDFVIELEIKLEGARITTLSVNAVKDHMARIMISSNRVIVRRDDNDHDGPDKAVVFAVFPTKLKSGVWHKVRLEMVGDVMLGQVGDLVAWGSDPLFKTPKVNPGLTVGGESVDFRNFVIREAKLNPKWEQVKKGLPKPGGKVALVKKGKKPSKKPKKK